jgi:hypothetical protein
MLRGKPGGSPGTAEQKLLSCSIEEVARKRLAGTVHYARLFRRIAVQYDNGVLKLRGRLPSFYLKQVLQTLLRDLEGVERIDNRVEVTNSTPRPDFPNGNGGVFAGLGRIRNARELLNDHATPLAKRLLDAGVEFLSATRFEDEWPPELRRAANSIKLRLLSAGDIASSVRSMDEDALDEVAEELWLFAKAARQLAFAHQIPRVR